MADVFLPSGTMACLFICIPAHTGNPQEATMCYAMQFIMCGVVQHLHLLLVSAVAAGDSLHIEVEANDMCIVFIASVRCRTQIAHTTLGNYMWAFTNDEVRSMHCCTVLPIDGLSVVC